MDDVPSQLKRYLNEIADQLWSNNAAVMVGAGFSRNAKPVGPTSTSFPNWQELGDCFFEKLNGRCPSKEDRYLSILKLAEQVEAAFGRPSLDQLLRDAIPDLRYEPSPLHSQLLKLPWKDVFTTNYDTLLERARASVTLKHYDVVATKNDLLYANQPRIVKLHGSFLSTTPFIITEEDYRRYPNDHAPFVNTVRQSLLENTLCLIGFSGDDPNFLQWIGWIRDHIGEEIASKIYLIGVFNTLDEGDKKLLYRRGIIVVDLSAFNTDPGKALDEFLKFLKKRSEERKKRTVDWPVVSADAAEMMKSDPNKYREAVAEWRRQRGEYPGWVVMPRDRRQFLWLYTEHWLSLVSEISSEDRGRLEAPLDLDLAFELAWRLDRCLFPLIGELPSFLEDMANKYSDKTFQLPENSHWTKPSSVFGAVVNIRLWLLRHYREQGLNDKWQRVRKIIESDLEKLLPEHKARFYLEEVFHALFCFDPDKAKRLLINWQSNDSLPFWEAKRAALMAELGEVVAARSILETSLSSIRQQLSLNPVIEDYTLVSQESIIMLLLWGVERGTIPRTRTTDSDSEMSERWKDLAQYKCDPNREIELLSLRLQHPAVKWRPERKTHRFDLGTVCQIFDFGSDKDVITAYGILRMYEDIGMPYRIGYINFTATSVKTTLPRIRPYSPHWALASIMRLGDASAIDKLFDREYLSDLRSEDVDKLFEIYLPAFKRTIAMINEPDLSTVRNFELLAKTLPDVLSRLCYKCSPVYREHLVEALRAIYGSRRKVKFEKIDQFARRLFESMSVKERARTVPLLIDFPVPHRLSEIERQRFINPVHWISLPASLHGEEIPVAEKKINKLLDQLALAGQDRAWTMMSLVWLHRRGKLNQSQSDRLGQLLWDGVEPPELPAVVGYYKVVYLKLPHPEDVEPESRVKVYLSSLLSLGMDDSTVDDVLDEFLKSARLVQWSNIEAVEFAATISEWWNKHKHQLSYHAPTPIGRLAEIRKHTIRKAVRALSEVFSDLPPDNDDEGVRLLQKLLAELAEHDIPAKVLDAAILSRELEFREKSLKQVVRALLHSNHDIVIDALLAAEIMARKLEKEQLTGEFAPVAAMLVQGVQWRHCPELAYRLVTIANLVENQSWFLSLVEVTDLLAGLEQIAEETSRGIRGNDEDGVITIRAEAARLAFVLSKYYQEHGSSEPEVIERWRELCRDSKDSKEFSEVKNAWPDIDI